MVKKKKSFDDMHFDELRTVLSERMTDLELVVKIIDMLNLPDSYPASEIKPRLLAALEAYDEFRNRFAAPNDIRRDNKD